MLYLFLTAIPLIFLGEYHFVQGVAELPYLAMLIGILIGGGMIMLFEKDTLKPWKIMVVKSSPKKIRTHDGWWIHICYWYFLAWLDW